MRKFSTFVVIPVRLLQCCRRSCARGGGGDASKDESIAFEEGLYSIDSKIPCGRAIRHRKKDHKSSSLSKVGKMLVQFDFSENPK